MKPHARLLAPVVIFAFIVAFCGFTAENAVQLGVPILVTSTPEYKPLAALDGGERFPQGARLLRIENGAAVPLVPDFASSTDASVSFDAKSVLFAGKKSAADPWQIWELTLADRSVRKVIDSAADAVRPLYLPGQRLVFARRTEQGSFTMIASDVSGKNELPLTYSPGSAMPADVLADGRILFESKYPLGSGALPELFLVYSDGSGVESYRCDHPAGKGRGRWGGHQLASGDVVFTHGAILSRFTSPLASEAPIAAPKADYSGGIVETTSGAWLLSVRTTPAGQYALRLWKPDLENDAPARSAVMTALFARPGENLVEPVVVEPRERPHEHPSALHDWNYANLLALDARQTREGTLKAAPHQVRLETRDNAGHAISMGTAPVESDGSFFVKAPADQPIRFALLDAKGETIRQEQGWFWIRRGEQRICVGCHTGPERAAENRVPAILLRSTTPTDLTVATTPDTARPNPQGSR
jgi:hypothetical protein